MLPREFRMHRSTDFSAVVRSGGRSRQGVLVVHHWRGLRADDTCGGPVVRAPLVGLIVSRAVGGSVVRHQVSRRLRAQLAARVVELPADSGTVVRALPGAADATSKRLGRDLERAFDMLCRPR